MGSCGCRSTEACEPPTSSACQPPMQRHQRSEDLSSMKTLLTCQGDAAPPILKSKSAPSLQGAPSRAQSAVGLGANMSPKSAAGAELISRSQKKRVTFGGAECKKFRTDLGGIDLS
mmetsp:Transcript_328/g.687  ORF Transcript_328/g.687 Transcript_328/m.687 type:complete len:116 (-) Transcript_328:291-638(-)|eukprot:CAMPEP_0115179188 /NCGR_PEP_ID=MMETSP0270-20121206/6283_1 /TAXON_ID=71861 /ORGANISM="Scrippsiella trochoidea, Strain CCMP3099" /LENGTH=115 /DNA_ID=CAMNT_0002592165 /DNA_START=57 /DNA_END=404 /DNA_ORIENTATION=+